MTARNTVTTLFFAITIALAAGPSCETTGEGATVECAVCTRTLPAEGSACTEPGCACSFLETCIGQPGTIEGQYACVGDEISADPAVGSWRITRTSSTCGDEPTSSVAATNAAASTAQNASSYSAFTATAADASSSSSGIGPGGGSVF